MFGSSGGWDTDKRIAIIGAGFGGIITGLRLKKLGITNFTIYEKAEEVGGTWRDNGYPGCSVDISSSWYAISTEPNPDWSESYPGREEIWQYQKDVVNRNGLRAHIQFNTMLTNAVWDEARQGYELTIERTVSSELTPYSGSTVKKTGETEVVFADVLIQAVGGAWSVPKYPTEKTLPGMEEFKGDMFHTAAWRSDIDFKGKRVAVIGNGATACQVVPTLAKESTTQVVNFCRTPRWLVERPQVNPSQLTKWIYRNVPLVQQLERFKTFLSYDVLYSGISNIAARIRPSVEQMYLNYMHKHAPKEYHEELKPKVSFGCHRIIRDPDYYASLAQPNVSLEWTPISRVTPTGILLDSGKHIELDVIVLATGFEGSSQIALPIRGRDGTTLKECWDQKGGPTAWGGVTVPNFPNHWMVFGPNSGSGHASAIFYEEVQVDYAMQMVQSLLKKNSSITSVELTAEACDTYNADIQKRISNTVWASCSSYYNRYGQKNLSLYPGPVTQFWWQLRRPNWGDYLVKKTD